MRHGGLEHVDLGVAVQAERVVVAHAGLHAAGGVQHEQVDAAPLCTTVSTMRLHGVVVGEVGADGEGAPPAATIFSAICSRAPGLVAVVHDDLRAGLGQVPDGVGTDAAGRPGDEGALAGE